MADSVTFKDEKSFEKLDGVRYRWDGRGVYSIADEGRNIWTRVDEGDKIEKYGSGYTVVRKDK